MNCSVSDRHLTSVIDTAVHRVTGDIGRAASLEARTLGQALLFVGVLRYYKGLRVLLEAVKDTPYRLIIAGKGPEEAGLKSYLERQRITNVVMAGHVCDEEKMALLTLARAFVLPSCERSEAFGVTLLEGAMSARPLISAEVGSGTSHVNIHGETGYLTHPDDIELMSEYAISILKDPKTLDEFKNKAFKQSKACMVQLSTPSGERENEFIQQMM